MRLKKEATYLVASFFNHQIISNNGIPFNFVTGSEGIPSYDARLENKFKQALLTVTPEFQDEHATAGEANLTVASNWVGLQNVVLALVMTP